MPMDCRATKCNGPKWRVVQVLLILGAVIVSLDLLHTVAVRQDLRDISGLLALLIAMVISLGGTGFSSPPSIVRQVLSGIIVIGIAVWTIIKMWRGAPLISVDIWWGTTSCIAILGIWTLVDWLVHRDRRRLLVLCAIIAIGIGTSPLLALGLEYPYLGLFLMALGMSGMIVWGWYGVLLGTRELFERRARNRKLGSNPHE